MLGTIDAAVDLPRFLAPAVALIVYRKLGSLDLLFVASSLPALVALHKMWLEEVCSRLRTREPPPRGIQPGTVHGGGVSTPPLAPDGLAPG